MNKDFLKTHLHESVKHLKAIANALEEEYPKQEYVEEPEEESFREKYWDSKGNGYKIIIILIIAYALSYYFFSGGIEAPESIKFLYFK